MFDCSFSGAYFSEVSQTHLTETFLFIDGTEIQYSSIASVNFDTSVNDGSHCSVAFIRTTNANTEFYLV